MRVLCCGDRDYGSAQGDWSIIWRELSALPPNTVVIHGNCRGADKMAAYVAKQLGFGTISFPAEWELYGRTGGPIRNKQMLVEGKPELVLAFHRNIVASEGTADMVRQAKAAGVTVKVIDI